MKTSKTKEWLQLLENLENARKLKMVARVLVDGVRVEWMAVV